VRNLSEALGRYVQPAPTPAWSTHQRLNKKTGAAFAAPVFLSTTDAR
jgi:hypothetical protein